MSTTKNQGVAMEMMIHVDSTFIKEFKKEAQVSGSCLSTV